VEALRELCRAHALEVLAELAHERRRVEAFQPGRDLLHLLLEDRFHPRHLPPSRARLSSTSLEIVDVVEEDAPATCRGSMSRARRWIRTSGR
jgi:hypothetical protein